jgi:hypothetical protein
MNAPVPVDSALEPAFPQGLNTGQPPGLSKREYVAAQCLQGILSNKGIHKLTIWSAAQSAIMFADQLLATLEGQSPEDAALQAPSDLAFAAGPSGD